MIGSEIASATKEIAKAKSEIIYNIHRKTLMTISELLNLSLNMLNMEGILQRLEQVNYWLGQVLLMICKMD